MDSIDSTKLDPRFKNDVAGRAGGENILLCYACGTCTAGCPVSAIDPEFNPRRIIRQVILGMRREVLASPVIWRCAQCFACTAKCPQNVRFREILRALREMAVEEGHAPAARIEAVEEAGRLAQTLRRALVNALVTDPAKYEEMKRQAGALAG